MSKEMKLRFSGGVPFARYDSMATDTGSSTVSRKYYGFDENFWHKIVRASEGNDTLDSKDAERILTLLKGDGEHETETRIASLIMSRLKSYGDLLDEGFLRYLSENYNKLIPVPEEPSHRESDTDEERRNSDHLDLFNKHLSSSVINELQKVYSWDFDIFSLQELTPCPLLTLLTHCLQEFHLIESLGFNPLKFHHFIHDIVDSYNPLPYHNSLHATDVTQTTFYLLSTGHIIDALALNQISVASILLAAAVHDVNHPGLNGKFLITTHSPLAIEYSDHSPLEMMHLAITFKLWREEKNNFTEGSSGPYNSSMIYREMRRLIIEMVLLTDNDMHFSLLNKLDRVVTMKSPSSGSLQTLQESNELSNGVMSEMNTTAAGLSSRTPLTHPTIDDRQLLLLQVTLHTADVSNTAKPWQTYMIWMNSIMEEFYLQGDQERALGMPISYAFDRYNPVTQSKFQLGFIKAIVGPLFKTFSKVDGVDISECLNQLTLNSKRWKELLEKEDESSTLATTASVDQEGDDSPRVTVTKSFSSEFNVPSTSP